MSIYIYVVLVLILLKLSIYVFLVLAKIVNLLKVLAKLSSFSFSVQNSAYAQVHNKKYTERQN